ncbi:hypothetical protein [Streptomyces sp. SID12488]|uniref:hypothetical protein n=1 Tax=Streptomyces sp. SID12488 TaxID=2706040 RepID=UPI0013DCC8C7|nr:hypothetical protein [Streptomyces sp. SID12488]NEA65311.1 hypothetical protein [Streptomyces sp. SID12488]
MSGPPSRWTTLMVLLIAAMVVARSLVAALAPVLPWLAVALVGSGGLGVIVLLLLRRSSRW